MFCRRAIILRVRGVRIATAAQETRHPCPPRVGRQRIDFYRARPATFGRETDRNRFPTDSVRNSRKFDNPASPGNAPSPAVSTTRRPCRRILRFQQRADIVGVRQLCNVLTIQKCTRVPCTNFTIFQLGDVPPRVFLDVASSIVVCKRFQLIRMRRVRVCTMFSARLHGVLVVRFGNAAGEFTFVYPSTNSLNVNIGSGKTTKSDFSRSRGILIILLFAFLILFSNLKLFIFGE